MSFLISCQRDNAKKDFIKKFNKKYTAVVNFEKSLSQYSEYHFISHFKINSLSVYFH